MVQIIDAPPRKPTFGQKLSAGVGRGLDIAGQLMNEYEQKNIQKKQQQSIRSYADQLGIGDISQFPMELQKTIIAENLKQQGKKSALQEKQNFLSQLFGTNQEKSSEEIKSSPSEFNPANISDADIARAASIDPVLGRELRAAKDTALREKRSEREFEQRKQEKSPEYIREKQLTSAQAGADVKYNQELQAAHKQHEIKTQTLNRLEELNRKGVTGKPYEKLLEKFGLVSQTSEGRREFAADVKNLITDIRSILGGQFSQFEFQTILNAYPSPDFSQKANETIIKNLKEFQDIRNQEFKIAKEIKKENGGKIPNDFQSQVNDRLQEYAQSKIPEIKANTQEIMREQLGVSIGNTILLAPDGEPIAVPNEEVERLMSLGATLP